MNDGDLSTAEIVFIALAALTIVALCALHAWLNEP